MDIKKMIKFLKNLTWLNFEEDVNLLKNIIKTLKNYSKLEKENKALKNKFKRKTKLPKGLVTGIPKKKNRRKQ